MKTMGMLLASVLLSAAAPSWAHEDVAVAQPQGEQRDAAVNDPRPVDDAPQLRQSIQAALQREATLKNQRVDVVLRRCRVDQTSQRCNVTLTGTVDTQAARATAERVARVKGVVLIDNRLELADTTADLVPDGALTQKVKEQFMADDTLKHAIIAVTTTDGVVALVGAVPSDAARRLAVDTAKRTAGVKRVEADLRLEPQASVAP